MHKKTFPGFFFLLEIISVKFQYMKRNKNDWFDATRLRRIKIVTCQNPMNYSLTNTFLYLQQLFILHVKSINRFVLLHVYNYLTNDLFQGQKKTRCKTYSLLFVKTKSPKYLINTRCSFQILTFKLVISIYYSKQINGNICTV